MTRLCHNVKPANVRKSHAVSWRMRRRWHLTQLREYKNFIILSILQILDQSLLTANSYVRGLESRVKELEYQLASALTPQNSQNDLSSNSWEKSHEFTLPGDSFDSGNTSSVSPASQPVNNAMPRFDELPMLKPSGQRPDSLAEELRLLTLEAAAERYLGCSSGLPLAKLTQTVLQRLSPDQDGFVFDEVVKDTQPESCGPDAGFIPNLNPISFEMNPSLASPLPLSSLFEVPTIDGYDDTASLTLLEPTHISCILEFYFAHSHTLYPIIQRKEFEEALWRVYANPSDPLALSPLWQFRIWMVLAIGSTTHCSVSLMDETEPVQFFNKAMSYFEPAMGCGDLVSDKSLINAISLGKNFTESSK